MACVCSANRAITVAQDAAAQTSLSCQQLEKSIATLMAERENLKRQFESVSREREREGKRKEEYRKRMAAHREKVSHSEQGNTINMDLAELQAKKQQLEHMSETIYHLMATLLDLCIIPGASYMHGEGLQILSGERQKELHESIVAAETAGALLDEETSKIRQMVSGRDKFNTTYSHTCTSSYHFIMYTYFVLTL